VELIWNKYVVEYMFFYLCTAGVESATFPIAAVSKIPFSVELGSAVT
jgi:hypothetical protein